MMAQPNVDGRKVVSFAEPLVHGTPDVVSSSMDEALHKAEHDTLNRKSFGNQGQSSSGDREAVVSDDVFKECNSWFCGAGESSSPAIGA